MPADDSLPAGSKRVGFRSGKRVNSRIAIRIEWRGNGETLGREGYTLDVSHNGCLAVIPQNLMLDQRVRLINLAGKQTVEAVIVWKGQERGDGWELGIKLLDPHPDFWGLEI
jgi:hypothetical protein